MAGCSPGKWPDCATHERARLAQRPLHTSLANETSTEANDLEPAELERDWDTLSLNAV